MITIRFRVYTRKLLGIMKRVVWIILITISAFFPSSIYKTLFPKTIKGRNAKNNMLTRSFKVSNWDILEFRRQFEIRTFIYLNNLDYGTLINKDIEESISNNFDVLCWNSPRCCPRGSTDGWIRFLFYKTCRYILHIIGRFTEKIRMIYKYI